VRSRPLRKNRWSSNAGRGEKKHERGKNERRRPPSVTTSGHGRLGKKEKRPGFDAVRLQKKEGTTRCPREARKGRHHRKKTVMQSVGGTTMVADKSAVDEKREDPHGEEVASSSGRDHSGHPEQEEERKSERGPKKPTSTLRRGPYRGTLKESLASGKIAHP